MTDSSVNSVKRSFGLYQKNKVAQNVLKHILVLEILKIKVVDLNQ